MPSKDGWIYIIVMVLMDLGNEKRSGYTQKLLNVKLYRHIYTLSIQRRNY